MAYDWGTPWRGIFERHADRCPVADGEPCICGPLGFVASIADPQTGERVFSPMLATAAEAQAWRSEQELMVDAGPPAPTFNGNGRGDRAAAGPADPLEPAGSSASMRRAGTRATSSPAAGGRAARVAGPARPRARGPDPARPRRAAEPSRARAPIPPNEAPPRRPRARQQPADPYEADMSVGGLIDMFLDAAEDGEARGADGRPYSDDELGELEWALAGYVEGHFGDMDVSAVRARHVFQLVDELEDAGMPRSRLRGVVGAVRDLFDYAADLSLVRTNPAAYVAPPADDRGRRPRFAETVESTARPRVDASISDSMVSERTIWFIVKIVALVFICIALVLVAESV